MITRLTFILFLLNLSIIGSLFFIKQNHINSSPQQNEILSQQEIKDIKNIKINFSTLDYNYTLKKNSDYWEIITPIEWSANPYAIQQLLSQIQFLEKDIILNVKNIQSSGQTLSDYGFDDPLLSIALETSFKAYTFKVSEAKNVQNKFYLLTPNEDLIYIVDNKFIENILTSLEALKSLQIFNIPLFEIRSLVVQKTKPHNLKVRLIKNENNWFFETPIQTDSDKIKTDKMLSNITSMRVSEFIDFEKQSAIPYGLNTPLFEITLEGYNKKETLLVGNPITLPNGQTQYYAQLNKNPALFLIDPETLKSLENIQENLRQKSLLRFNPETLTSIRLSKNDRNLNLQKLEIGSWIIAHTDHLTEKLQTRSANQSIINEVIQNLTSLEILNFVSDAPSVSDLERLGLLNSKYNIELKLQGNESLILTLGNTVENNLNNIYAKINNSPSIYEISNNILKQLPFDALYYEGLTLINLPNSTQIQSLSVTNLESNQLVINKTNHAGDIAHPLAQALKTFKIDSYFNANFNETFIEIEGQSTYWKYAIKFDFFLPGDNPDSHNNHTLLLTTIKDNKTLYGFLIGQNFVFKIPDEFSSLFYNYLNTPSP